MRLFLDTHIAIWAAFARPRKDPFDELLVVQAQVEGMRPLNRDRLLLTHPLALPGSAPA